MNPITKRLIIDHTQFAIIIMIVYNCYITYTVLLN